MFDFKKYLPERLRTQFHKKHASTKDTKTHGWRGWLHKWRWYVIGGLAVLFMTMWGMSASADAPTDFGYPLKRGLENVSTFFTVGSDAKEEKRAGYAAQRIDEAVNVVDQAGQTPKQQVANAQTVQNLVEEYIKSYTTSTATLSQSINDDTKFSNKKLISNLHRNVQTYTRLMELRLEAPPTVQATILQAMSVMQNSVATMQDALQLAPVTPADSNELSKLVSQGFLTRAELTQMLASTTSNRQFLDSLRNLIRSGQLPSNATYAINYDLVKEFSPKQAARFAASVTFDEMNKVVIFAETVTPTPEQKQAVQAYMAQYKVGDILPRDVSTRAFVMPLVYGLNLTPDLPNALQNLDTNHLGTVRKTLYDIWKPLATDQAAKDPKQLYSQILQLTATATHSAALMEQVELEVLNAVRANVAYLALPPGWTAAQVAAVQDEFAQQIKDLRSLNTTITKANTALNTVADMTSALVTPESEPKVEAIRVSVEQQIADLQKTLITSANATTDPTAIVPDIKKRITALQQSFDAQVAALGKTSGIASAEVTVLRQDVKDALASALQAQTQLKDYITASATIQGDFASSIATVIGDQTQTATSLRERIAKLDASTQATVAGSAQSIQAAIGKNLASLQEQLVGANKAGIEAETQLQLNFIAHSNQIALLEDKLNLSETTRAALKTETDQTISQLKAEQAALITNLQKQINDDSALRAQLNDTAKNEINAIKAEQAQLLSSLQQQGSSKQLLEDQLKASIATLQAVQDLTESKVQTVTSANGSLATQLQALKADLNAANQTIQTNTDQTALARTELQQGIDDLKLAQILAQTQVQDGFEAMAIQLRQAVGQLADAQSKTELELTGLAGSVDSVKESVTSILTTQVTVQAQMQAQSQANIELRNEVTASISQLQQAQAATQAQVDTLNTDVGLLKTSVATISSTQAAAQQQIDQLLTDAINWRDLPGTLQFSQDQFRLYQQQLADEFAAKAVALQQQFEEYKQQLEGSINQLRTDTNAELSQLKTDQALLKTQLEQAQQQLQKLQTPTATTPTTTTTTPSL